MSFLLSTDATSRFISFLELRDQETLEICRRYEADFGWRHVIDFQFSCALHFERRTPSDGANNAPDKIISLEFRGQMFLDIVLGQSIIEQQPFARTSRRIVVLLGKCKREVRVRVKVRVRVRVKVSVKVSWRNEDKEQVVIQQDMQVLQQERNVGCMETRVQGPRNVPTGSGSVSNSDRRGNLHVSFA